ncbi:amidohydrolase/deacetylase family metallohydrolase [Nitratireductor sp. CAU 1489]|uniref:Amidohydrolase/deacetylase family metallohydrolase n=1 Tax=Nitratireductor arenosus TaxID=2682096 RepID=A0A844QHK9_9HYPH|nr:amidohydrolase/deacetylase family metallohydrolase [Nitratireductor arenosus]MVA98657.1 amidohydrolase/deacetylase family metallohydrolase [Nitratireductor arenosus]
MVSTERPYDLLLAGGRLIDPRNGVDGVRDIAITGGRVAAIAPRLEPDSARDLRDLRGLVVTPGLIDLHTHIYHRATSYGVEPDPVAERSAVTCMVDAGSAGAGNFAGLRDFVIARSRSRVLAFLNISFPGIFAFDSGLMFGEASLAELLSVERCVAVAHENRDLIVGIKVRLGAGTSGRIGLEALDRAVEAARQTSLPVMTHIGKPPPGYDEILARLRPGDILTHCFRPAPNAPVDETGRLLPALIEARRRGVLFDIGHGMGAFGFASAEAAISGGFPPDIVSSDVHMLCVDGPAFDLLHTMSKLVTCGVSLSDAIAMATDAPAQAMRRPDLGHLSLGAPADISLIETVEARYPFVDVAGVKREGAMLLRPRGLLRAGQFFEPGPRSWEAAHYRDGGSYDD